MARLRLDTAQTISLGDDGRKMSSAAPGQLFGSMPRKSNRLFAMQVTNHVGAIIGTNY
jgi:hypothetical protein